MTEPAPDAIQDPHATTGSQGRSDDRSTTAPIAGETDRADRVAEWIAVPVLIAALASIPAVFLTLFGDPWETVGNGLNTLSGGVLIAETAVLFLVSEDRIAWIRRNRWLVLLALLIIPAVIFAVGPVQLLRLARVLRVVGALRIIRVGRIIRAGKILRERADLDHRWQRVIGVAATLLCAAFVALVLTDPTSTSREFLDGAVDRLGWVGVLVAGLILGVATYVVHTARNRTDDDAPQDPDTHGETIADDAPEPQATHGETIADDAPEPQHGNASPHEVTRSGTRRS